MRGDPNLDMLIDPQPIGGPRPKTDMLKSRLAEAVRELKWIKEFSQAHHAGESAGVHLHRLLVDIPDALDNVIATLEGE